MFNRSQIMKEAHHYARSYAGRDWSYAKLLSWGLKYAWQKAKDGKTEAEHRAEAIRVEIDALKYKSLKINIEPKRRQLEAELSALAA